MLEIKSIRKNVELYSSGLLKRGLSDSKEKLNKIIHHDDNRKLYKTQKTYKHIEHIQKYGNRRKH